MSSNGSEVAGSRVAVVTGAGSGIGRATALHFARRGARVAAVDVDAAKLDGVVAEIGPQARGIAADVSRDADVRRVVEETCRSFGRIDVLVNAAGVMFAAPLDRTTEDDWDRVLAVNLKGTFLCAKHVAPAMRAGGGGTIVNTASVHSWASAAPFSAYAASKGGVLALTRELAVELAPDRIRVTCVVPGVIDTPMLRADPRFARDAAAAERVWAERSPIGRIGGPEEVAAVVYFLASEEAAFVTGSPIFVDGGMLARLYAET